MAWTVKCTAVLPDDADVPPGFQDFVEGAACLYGIFRTVKKHHVCTLRHGYADAIEALGDIAVRESYIFLNDRHEFMKPLCALLAVAADQRVHGENIHIIVVRLSPELCDFPSQLFVVNDMVAADKACHIESLARRTAGHDMIFRPVIYTKGRGEMSLVEDQVVPDLIANC